MNSVRLRAYFGLLVAAIIWGLATAIVKFTLGGFTPFVFLTYRFFISSILAVIIFTLVGIKFPKDPKIMILTIFYGFLTSTVTLGLLFWGVEKTSSVDANVLSAMAPITVA